LYSTLKKNIRSVIFGSLTCLFALFLIWTFILKESNDSIQREVEQPNNIVNDVKQKISVNVPLVVTDESPLKSSDVTYSFLESSEQCEIYEIDGGALVVAIRDDDVRVSELNADGTGFSINLPFYPTAHTHIIKREDGRVLSLLSDLRLNSKVGRARDTDEPVKAYLDDEIIFETQKALDVGAASDGSSFYIIKPAEGSRTELIIYDLALDLMSTHDVTHLYGASGRYRFFASRMTLANDAIWIQPSDESMEDQTHYLFPVNGSAPLAIDTNFSWRKSPVFYNLNTVFILSNNINENTVSMQAVDLISYIESEEASASYQESVLWQIDLPGYSIQQSNISAFENEILLDHAGIRVLDIDSGDVKFTLSDNKQEQREKLRWGQDVGRIVQVNLSQTGIKILRQIGLEHLDNCMIAGGDFNKCKNELRNKKLLFDVVDTFKNTDFGYSEFVSNSKLKKFGRCNRGDFHTGKLGTKNSEELSYTLKNTPPRLR